MDLMEYQAKELFAKHGVAMTLGKTVESADDARAAAEEIGGTVVVKAQVKAGGRGKAGGVKLAKTPEEAEEHAGNILGWPSRASRSTACWSSPPRRSRRSTTSPSCWTAPTAPTCASPRVEGGVEIEEVAKTNPDAVKKIPINAGTGVDEAKATEIVDEAGFPAELKRPGRRDGPGAVDGLHRGGRHPGRGQPAGPAGGRQARGARRQGLARRERRLPPRGPRRSSRTRTRPTRWRPRPRTRA